MMSLEEINKMWAKDCKIDEIDLEAASRETARLHQKYLELFMVAKMQLKRRDQEKAILLKDRWLYFTGKMSQAEMTAKGWPFDPFDGLKILRTDLDYYFQADPLLQKADEKITYAKVLAEALEDILGMIRWRHQHIKTIMEYRRFTSGN